MPIICNARVTNAALTGAQRYTLSILNHIPEIERISPSEKNSRGMRGHLWEQLIMPGLIGKKLLWSPSNSGPVARKRQVLTVHDVVSFDHPEWFNKTYVKWYNIMLPLVCKNAAHIITISQFTKQRIIELFNIPESKITIVYNGGGERQADNTMHGEAYDLPFKRYILSVGSLEIRKNIPFLLESWNSILAQVPDDVGLIIVGGKGNKKIFQDANIHQIPDRVHFTGHIPDDFVTYLYANALAFVYLSTYEGFGLPPLEAMAAGVPVICGNLTAIPEVVENAGILIDPYSKSACEQALVTLINDEALRARLSQEALLQAKKFNWKKAADETYEILKRFE